MPEPPEPTTGRPRCPAHPRRVANARRRADRVLAVRGANQETVGNVSCVVSELVTSAVVHARTPKGREVGGCLPLLDHVQRLEVRGADPASLTPASGPTRGTHLLGRGRGLLVAARSCKGRWGSAEEIIGKTVWEPRSPVSGPSPRGQLHPYRPGSSPGLCRRSGAQ